MFHIFSGVLGAFFVYFLYNSFIYSSAFFFFSIFIDLDHLFDYFMFFGFNFHLKYFLRRDYIISRKVYVPCHSWELVITLIVISIFLKIKLLCIISFALFIHLLIDQFFHHSQSPLFYLLSWRIINKFNYPKIDKNGYLRDLKRLFLL